MLVQITTVYAGQARQPRGSRPFFELDLQENQQIVGVNNYWTTDMRDRETIDHHANFFVATKV